MKHVDLQAVKTSLDTWIKSLQKTLADTKNDLYKDAQTMKAERRIDQERMEAKTQATQRKFQTSLKEVSAGANRNQCRCGEAT
jgi:Skp family chaperone for outer membrane proteins